MQAPWKDMLSCAMFRDVPTRSVCLLRLVAGVAKNEDIGGGVENADPSLQHSESRESSEPMQFTQELFAWVVSWLTMTDRLPFRNRWSVIAGKWWCAFMRLAAHCFHSGSRYFPEIFHHRWGTIAGPTAEKPNKQAQGEDRWTWNVCSSVPLSSCLILIDGFHNLLLLFVSHPFLQCFRFSFLLQRRRQVITLNKQLSLCTSSI